MFTQSLSLVASVVSQQADDTGSAHDSCIYAVDGWVLMIWLRHADAVNSKKVKR